MESPKTSQSNVLLIGRLIMGAGMLIQLCEFYYWMSIPSSNLPKSLYLLLEVILFSYSSYICINKWFPAKSFFEFLSWIVLVISSAIFIYTVIYSLADWSGWGPLYILIGVVFLGSDLLMSAGILYLFKYYQVEQELNKEYILIGYPQINVNFENWGYQMRMVDWRK